MALSSCCLSVARLPAQLRSAFGSVSYHAYHHDHSKQSFADFRSDTVTKPTEGMRDAMRNALVGDDVFREDPTVRKLEEKCADFFGKEASLFVASGTMGNLLSIMSHTERGDEVIVGKMNHIHRWEKGNVAQIAGVSSVTVPVSRDGRMELSDIRECIRDDPVHMPHSRLICLENTHTYCGGVPLPLSYLNEVRALADENNLLIHIDGARIYNAAIALGTTVKELAAPADSVQMCFSKGLGAPVGSIIVGDAEFITKARNNRKALGGGWRQAGILAAAAIYALENGEETIRNDHSNAQYLFMCLNQSISLKSSVSAVVNTNVVILSVYDPFAASELASELADKGIFVMPMDNTRLRIVLNLGVRKHEIDALVEVCSSYFKSK